MGERPPEAKRLVRRESNAQKNASNPNAPPSTALNRPLQPKGRPDRPTPSIGPSLPARTQRSVLA